jgi:thiopeptide-type bacteriocin biosynthesis protein
LAIGRKSPQQLADAVRAALAGGGVAEIAAAHSVAVEQLQTALTTYHASGTAALERSRDRWYTTRLTFTDHGHAEKTMATVVGPLLDTLCVGSLPVAWWYARGEGDWRVRLRHPDRAVLGAFLDDLGKGRPVAASPPLLHDPDMRPYGGPVGTAIAYGLSVEECRSILAYAATSLPMARRDLSIAVLDVLLSAAGLSFPARGAVYAQVAALGPAYQAAEPGGARLLAAKLHRVPHRPARRLDRRHRALGRRLRDRGRPARRRHHRRPTLPRADRCARRPRARAVVPPRPVHHRAGGPRPRGLQRLRPVKITDACQQPHPAYRQRDQAGGRRPDGRRDASRRAPTLTRRRPRRWPARLVSCLIVFRCVLEGTVIIEPVHPENMTVHHPSTPSPGQLTDAVRRILAGHSLRDVAGRHGLAIGELRVALAVYDEAGRAALAARSASRWYSIRLMFADLNRAEHTLARVVAPALDTPHNGRAPASWWFLRDLPDWRVHLRNPDLPTLGRRLRDLVHRSALAATQPEIHDPDTRPHCGLTGTAIAYDLAVIDSRGILDYTRLSDPPLARREFSIALVDGLLSAAGLEWSARGHVYRRLAATFPTVTRRLGAELAAFLTDPTLTLATFAAPWANAFTTAGTHLADAATHSLLARPITDVLAAAVHAHWNRFGLSSATQAVLAHAGGHLYSS